VHLGDAFGLSAALDADRYVLESGLLASPDAADLEYDHLACDHDTAFPFPSATSNSNFDLFDFNEFLTDELNVLPAAEQQQQQQPSDRCLAAPISSLLDLENQVTSEDPNLQPPSGASSLGCDDGGIAVGVI
jgi:transcriptional activator HAC1